MASETPPVSWRPSLVALVLVFAVPAGWADHVEGEGRQVSFDHVEGNEWWVEVALGGPDAASVAKVEAKDTGGAWVELEKKSWGPYAASFHIEPGHEVRFRATWSDDAVRSCWFSHPEGVEQCGHEGSQDIAFNHNGGNEWWVQVGVEGDPARVQAQDTGGRWVELEHKDWGDWAASFHIESGHDVRFRALADTAWHESCWFTHPGGKALDCAPAEEEPAGDFDASFDPKPGNEWWVEVLVDADQGIAGVDARADGGQWVALEKKSWGAWAKSFHVPDGSIVEFRATSTAGEQDVSGQYRWPEATRVSSEPEPGTDVAFGPKASNEWWVETLVVFNGTVTGVEALADGGPWHKLSLRDWGAWAASFHVPDGSIVAFRATTDKGQGMSNGFVWPHADVVGGDGSWPEEGSYARYETHASDPVSQSDGTLTLIFNDGQWWARSERVVTSDSFPTQHETGFCDDAVLPHGPLPVTEGDRVDVVVGACFNGTMEVVVERQDAHSTHQDGDPATMETWRATRTADCNCQSWTAEWDRSNGLLALSHFAGSRSSSVQDLEDTDAPIQTG